MPDGLIVAILCALGFAIWYHELPKGIEHDLLRLFRRRRQLHDAAHSLDLKKYDVRQTELANTLGRFVMRWQYDEAAMTFAKSRMAAAGTSLDSVAAEVRRHCHSIAELQRIKAELEQVAAERHAAWKARHYGPRAEVAE